MPKAQFLTTAKIGKCSKSNETIANRTVHEDLKDARLNWYEKE